MYNNVIGEIILILQIQPITHKLVHRCDASWRLLTVTAVSSGQSYHENGHSSDRDCAHSSLHRSYNNYPVPAKLRKKMVAEKVRKNCIGKHGENKHEEPGPATEETVIKPWSCSCETGTLKRNKAKFLS